MLVLLLARLRMPPMALAPGRAADAEAQVGDPGPRNDLRVVEEQGRVRELAEEADALAQEHRRQVDGDLVDQAQVERLLDDAGPGQGDRLAARDRPWPGRSRRPPPRARR